MPGFSELELNEFDFKNYMDPSALIDTLSPNDMWNGYNFFTDENINTSIKDDIKEENLDMDCCFSSICPNDLINSIESSLIKSNSLHDDNYDYKSISSSSSSSVSPDTHSLDTFDFVPCLLQDQSHLNASSDLLTVGLDNEKTIKYELDSMSSSPCSSTCSTLPSPSQQTEQKSGQIYQIHNLQQSNNSLLKKSNVISVDKSKIKSPILPPSPPSSFGSDSESNQSCQSVKKSLGSSQTVVLKKNNSKNAILKQIRHQPYQVKSSNCQSKNKSINNSKSNHSNNNPDDDCWPFFVSLSKLPSSGPILLTEEEKRTLIQEGHQVPTQLPLTKGEEKILKKIRRKIKNKISAQESRRKKKEYVDSLERRMENYINENQELKKRLEDLELNNKNLLLQLEKMKSSLSQQSSQSQSQSTSQTNITDFNQSQVNSTNQFSTLIMVLVLFFTVVFGIWSPVITKDQLTNSAACTAASVSTNSINRSQASSSAAIVAVATAAATAATVSVKVDAQTEEPKQQSLKSIVSFDDDSQSLKRKHEDDDLMNNSLETSQAISQNNFIARSKTGTAVELTKVRPFIGKLSTISKSPNVIPKPNLPQTNQTAGQANDYFILNNSNSEDSSQIIILNLANNGNNNAQDMPKNNIRVINSNQATSTGSKLPTTRFRVINNGQNFNSINQAVIKLSSS